MGITAVAAGEALIDDLPDDLPETRVVLGRDRPGWTGVEAPMDRPVPVELPEPPRPDDVFALAFSSGTTGRAKGIPWRHSALARSTMTDAIGVAGMHEGARQLLVAPTFHLAGFANLLMGLSRGAEIHLRTSFDPAAVLDDIERLGVEYMTAVPAMFRAMTQCAETLPVPPDTSSMLEMTYGASPIDAELLRSIRALFPRTRLRQFYGMTELGGALTVLTPEAHDDPGRCESAGTVSAGCEVELVDLHGSPVPDGEPGEILVRSDSLMLGYWRDPEATAQVMQGGWFATGDIAIRRDGYLTIVDRAKDMIVSGGENVSPTEVEAVLHEHPAVADVAVIGVPDERTQERVHAVVVFRPGDGDVTLDDLQQFCRSRLAGYKLPRSLEIVDELPRNTTGKVLRRDLRAPHWQGRSRAI
jgi:acyl-CoA synthetase (AMP-forming)/AMP-acid ligase II